MSDDEKIAVKALHHGGLVTGMPSGLSESQDCENWMVPCDRGSQAFAEWLDEQPQAQTMAGALALVRNAWDHAHQRHCATLRRIGWLDQKGRVWTEIPSGKLYNGGSYTPLLIDAREH